MTTAVKFPGLDYPRAAPTRDALHAYAGILGGWLKSCRPKRKHWWHASLRPSLTGLTTGVIHCGASVELQLNLRDSLLEGRTAAGVELVEKLHGQSAAEFAAASKAFLLGNGIDPATAPGGEPATREFSGYSPAQARDLASALTAVSATMQRFRAGIREETSPIQLWPHHFDLSMLWLPGELVAGEDPADEESADKQMNFGFTFGDDNIEEPYFYVTAYPNPDGFTDLPLPAGTSWHSDGFNGALLLYRDLLEKANPNGFLLEFWRGLLTAGREHLLDNAR